MPKKIRRREKLEHTHRRGLLGRRHMAKRLKSLVPSPQKTIVARLLKSGDIEAARKAFYKL